MKYRVELVDGTTVAESPKEGIEFYVKDGELSLMTREDKVLLVSIWKISCFISMPVSGSYNVCVLVLHRSPLSSIS